MSEQEEPIVADSPAPPPSPRPAAAERYVRAKASIPELPAGEEGWVPNDERVQALLERGMLEEATPPK